MKSLHKLIHNLHPTEKRYIKLRFKANKADSYLVDYFDYLTKQKEYDFIAFQKEFTHATPKILQNSLRKLYNAALKHLRSYNSTSSPDNVMQGMLSDIKILKDKGMLKEAAKLNSKLEKMSNDEEAFHIQKEAIQNQWNILHILGQLGKEKTLDVKNKLEEVALKENELEAVNSLYRDATTLYYQYFFYERTDATKQELLDVCEADVLKDMNALNSSKAKMTFFEIDAMKYILLGDILGHHSVRKAQFRLLFESKVFEKDYLSKLLVLSNVFTYLKSAGAVQELQAYMKFLKRYFLPFVEKNSDGVLIEKYYDIYFQNNIFLQNWYADEEEIERLITEFKEVSNKEFKRNNLLVSRTYLALSQLLILTGDYKKAIRNLIDFQSLALDKKTSEYFIQSEMNLLFVYYQMEKMDVFDSRFLSIRKKVRAETIELDDDLMQLFYAFDNVYSQKSKHTIEYTGSKVWLKIYLAVLNGAKMEDARTENYNLLEDKKSDMEDELLLYVSRI